MVPRDDAALGEALRASRGTELFAAVDDWVRDRLNARAARVVWMREHLSRVMRVELNSGTSVVLKVRPYHERLEACGRVQAAAHAAGLPCPAVLDGPVKAGRFSCSVEQWVPGGEQLDLRLANPARLFADALHAVVRGVQDASAEALADTASVLPWVGWRHAAGETWPPPDDLDADLNAFEAPSGLDDIAARARSIIQAHDLPRVIGHGDWESQNLRWRASRLHCIHDWDSVVFEPEAALVGAAAAVYGARGGTGEASTFDETAAFIAAYDAARPGGLSPDEWSVAWAAGVWVLAFNAKKGVVAVELGLREGVSYLPALERDLTRRLGSSVKDKIGGLFD